MELHRSSHHQIDQTHHINHTHHGHQTHITSSQKRLKRLKLAQNNKLLWTGKSALFKPQKLLWVIIIISMVNHIQTSGLHIQELQTVRVYQGTLLKASRSSQGTFILSEENETQMSKTNNICCGTVTTTLGTVGTLQKVVKWPRTTKLIPLSTNNVSYMYVSLARVKERYIINLTVGRPATESITQSQLK